MHSETPRTMGSTEGMLGYSESIVQKIEVWRLR
jgi:hypothetical protein